MSAAFRFVARSDGWTVSGLQFIKARIAIRKTLGYPNGFSTPLVGKQVPDTSAAGTGEQPQLALASLAPQEPQHGLRVGAGQPLGLGHGLHSLPKIRSTTQQPRTCSPG